MEKILVSACLFGQRVRYDAKLVSLVDARLQQWRDEGRLVVICPEVAGGMPVPRPAAAIAGVGGGVAVWKNKAEVLTEQGESVTDAFKAGAELAASLVKKHDIKFALLKERSPSCGANKIYAGPGSREVIEGEGVTAAYLRELGVKVFSEEQLDLLEDELAEFCKE